MVYLVVEFINYLKMFQALNSVHMPLAPIYTPWKHQKTRGFLMFSSGIERDQWRPDFMHCFGVSIVDFEQINAC